MARNSGSATADSSGVCCTTAGNCLWSPMRTKRPIDSTPPEVAPRMPTTWGSSICDASSMMARLKRLSCRSAGLELTADVVAHTTLADDMAWRTWPTLLQQATFWLRR